MFMFGHINSMAIRSLEVTMGLIRWNDNYIFHIFNSQSQLYNHHHNIQNVGKHDRFYEERYILLNQG